MLVEQENGIAVDESETTCRPAKMKECPFCRGQSVPMSWGGRECLQCGSVSVLSPPSQKDLEIYYDDFNANYDGGGGNLQRYAGRYLREVVRFHSGGRLVDVGPSRSPFPNLASRAGFRVTAIDYIRPEGLQPDVVFIPGNLNSDNVLEKISQPFDVVCNFAVIEHCMYPDLACEILSKLCTPGGHIILTTPEIGTFATSNALGRSGWFCPPKHLNLLSKKTLTALFERHGARLVADSRLELNAWRWLARYGCGAIEGCAGMILRKANPRWWRRQRNRRVQTYKGIALYVFEKF